MYVYINVCVDVQVGKLSSYKLDNAVARWVTYFTCLAYMVSSYFKDIVSSVNININY